MKSSAILLALLIAVPAFAQTAYGPQSTMLCPPGAVDIWPGQSIQLLVTSYPMGSTFCIRAGVYPLTSSITPKTGDIFVGEYGAILDGSTWSTSDDTQAAFRAHNEDIDYVTIRNLVIRKMPQQGIHAFWWMADHWTIENNEIAYNKTGLEFAPDFIIRNNFIHHNVSKTPYDANAANRGGGYIANQGHNTIFDHNEISFNGMEQKVAGQSVGVTFRNNSVHDNLGDGIWYDGNPGANALIELNRVENNGRTGITFEISTYATIRNNTVRGNAGEAVLISMSQHTDTYGNQIEGNFGGPGYYLRCASLTETGHDLTENAAHDNTITVGTQPYAYASGLSSNGCTTTQLALYLNGTKRNTFTGNKYVVANATASNWYWDVPQTWTQWQALLQDATGSLNGSGSVPPPIPLIEVCGDGIDNDGDGLIDEGCTITPPPPPPPPPPVPTTTCTLEPYAETVRNKFVSSETTRLQKLGYAVTPKPLRGGYTTLTAACP